MINNADNAVTLYVYYYLPYTQKYYTFLIL